MRKNALKYLLQVVLFAQSLICLGQSYDPNVNVQRGVLGGLIFQQLFGSGYDVNEHPVVNFPSPYIDLQENNELWNQLKIVSLLSHGNAVSPFYSEAKGIAFKPYEYSGRASAIMNLLEACNIAPASSGSEPFSDVVSGDYYYPYLVKAYQLNIIRSSDGSNFRPYSNVTNSELLVWINRMKSLGMFDFSLSELENLNNFLIPQNYLPFHASLTSGLAHGVFNHYSKSSFSIPDIKLNLGFDHFYSSFLAELPLGMYPITPLGKGWSHNYNSYIVLNEVENDDVYSIVWPDGSIHHYNDDTDEYLTKGIFDEVSFQDSKRTIIITHKDQSVHEYYKEDTSEDIWYLRRINDKYDNSIRIYYDDNVNDNYQHITKVRAPSGKELIFRYTSLDLLEEIEDPAGRKINFEFSGTSPGWFYQYPVLSSFTDAKRNETTYSYTEPTFGSHLLTRVKLPRGNVIYATYNKDKKLTQVKVNNEPPINISFEINYNSNTNTFKSNIKTTLPNGTIENNIYSFDKNENFKGLINNTQNIEVTYPTSGNLIHLPNKVISNKIDKRYTYDSKGNVTKITTKGTSHDIVEIFVYDAKNNLIQYIDAENNVTDFFYDFFKRNLLQIRDALGNSIFFKYNTNGQLLSVTNQEGIKISFGYNTSGVITNIYAPEGINITQNYDVLNRLRSRIENGVPTYFDFDDNDNLIKIIDPLNNPTRYEFNENDFLKRVINAKGVPQSFEYNNEDQMTSNSFNGLTSYYDYDKGQLSSIKKPSNAIIDVDYDSKGRTNSYGDVYDIDYTDEHQMESIANDVGRIYFKYDEFKRVSEIKTVQNKTVKYEYRKTGQINKIEYPTLLNNTARVEYSFDPKNRVNYINFTFNGKLFRIADFSYRKDDKIKSIIWGNGVMRSNGFDSLGRVKEYEIKKPNAAII
jgi:YD repeat-containing protein